jgi:hypothetical protein
MSYADLTNLIRFFRVDTGDDGSVQNFSDIQITSMIAKGTIRLDTKLGNPTEASGGFIAFVQATSGDIPVESGGSPAASGVFTLPSGAELNGLPTELFNLVLLQTECMYAKRKYFDSVLKGIRVKDGDTEIDTTAGFSGYDALIGGAGVGVCDELKACLEDFNKRIATDPAVWGDIIWKGNTRRSQLHTHNDTSTAGRNTEIFPDYDDWFRGHNDNDPSDRVI